MKASLMGVLLATTAAGATAQVVSGSLFASHDSDSFNEQKLTLGYTGPQGWGVKTGALRYSAPGWSETGSLLAATYQSDTTVRQIHASLGVTHLAQHDHLVGSLDYLRLIQPGISLGLSAERDSVNSLRGIPAGITYNAVALVGDYAFTDRFNVGASAGATFFSDGNQRPLLRTRWNYSLDEQYGLNLYLKTRHYQNSDPHQPAYFSPDHLGEVSVGLSSRFAVANSVVVSASVDTGRQHVDGESGSIWSAAVGLASPRGSKVDWMVGLESTNTASLFTVNALSYRYTSLVARINVPF